MKDAAMVGFPLATLKWLERYYCVLEVAAAFDLSTQLPSLESTAA